MCPKYGVSGPPAVTSPGLIRRLVPMARLAPNMHAAKTGTLGATCSLTFKVTTFARASWMYVHIPYLDMYVECLFIGF